MDPGPQRHNKCGLEHMPPELILHIASFLDHAGDMAAARMASRLFAGRSAVDMAIAHGAVYTGRVLEAGAPIDVVCKTVEARGRPLGRGFIESAVRGGRMDVLRFVCDLVGVRVTSLSSARCMPQTDDQTAACVCEQEGVRGDQYDPLRHDRDPDQPHQTTVDSKTHGDSAETDDDIDDVNVDDNDIDDDDDDDGSTGSDDDGDEGYANHGVDGNTERILYEAMCAACVIGHADALRYLSTRPILGQYLARFVDEDLMIRGARAGHISIVAYVHDRKTSHYYADGPCSCTERVGRAAWKAPTPDAAMWLRDFGCRGYVAPTVRDVGRAIARGRTALLRHLVKETALGRDVHALAPFIMLAARRGHVDTLRFVAENGLCPYIDPVLIGAAQGGAIDVLWWALYGGDGDNDTDLLWRKEWGRPSAMLMRAAALAAAAAGHADAILWIGKRHPAIVDLTLLCAAINSGSVNAVRAVDRFFSVDFDWARVAARIIETDSVDMIRFLVEEKAVTIDPLAVADVVSMSDTTIEYILSVCAPNDMQTAFDVALADDAFRQTPRITHLRGRVPGLCTSAVAVDYVGPDSRCACARCASGPDARSTPFNAHSHMRD
nr:hypothetical protein [Pandoravirus aubagnensis]